MSPTGRTSRRSLGATVALSAALLVSLLPLGTASAAVGGPTVTLTSATPNPTNGTIAVTATFSAPVTGFVVGDITVANGTAGSFTGVDGDSVYTYVVTATTNGLVSTSVAADQAFDAVPVGNQTSNSLTRTYDATAPTVSSIVRGSSSPTNATSVTFTVTFAEAVTGVTTGAFGLTTTGFAGLTTPPAITTVSADSGATRTLTVGTGGGAGTPNGTIRLDLTTTAGIIDAAGNALTATFTGGEVYTIDKTVPTATIVFPVTTATYTSGTWLTLSGTAADTGGAVVASDKYSIQKISGGLYWNGAGFGSGSEAFTTASGTTAWTSTFAFSNFPSDGSYTMRAYATDSAGNVSAAATSTFTIDTNPSVTLSSSSVNPTSSVIHVVATFSEAMNVGSFISSDLSVTNATVSSFTGSGASYSFDLFGLSNGTVSVLVPAAAATGPSGTNTVSNTLSWTYDTSGPTVAINQASSQADPTGGSPISFTAVFTNGQVNTGTFDSSDVTVNGTAGGTKAVSITLTSSTASSSTFNLAISGMTSSGTVIPTIAADRVLSSTGKPNRASTSSDNTVSYVLPSKWIVTASTYTPTPGQAITVNAQLADASNNAVPGSGIVVTWSATSGGTFSAATSTTNASGLATVTFTVSATTGTIHRVSATGNALAGTSTDITVTQPTAAISLTSSATIVNSGVSFVLNVQFQSLGANRQVQIERLSPIDPTWVPLPGGNLTTNALGSATFVYTSQYNAQYRAVFAGTVDLKANTSNVARVLVRYKGTIGPGSGTTRIVAAGTKVTYTGQATPVAPAGLQRVTFLIYKRVGGIWTFRTSATIPVNSAGKATFTWRWSRGEWYIRVRSNATIYDATSYSPIAKVTAR